MLVILFIMKYHSVLPEVMVASIGQFEDIFQLKNESFLMLFWK